jgi:ATP-binding cassette, subfamily C (CFTR/MRP), member 2
MPLVFLVVIWLYRCSIAATKETARIESVTRSPLLSYMSETINGNQTIRAFGKERDFIEHNYKLLNDNILACQWCNAAPLWFAIRVDLVSIATMMVIAVFCVLFRNESSPIMLALLLSYSVVLQQYVISTIRMMMQIEARMVNADRCLNLLKIPQENFDGCMPLEDFKRINPDWPS